MRRQDQQETERPVGPGDMVHARGVQTHRCLQQLPGKGIFADGFDHVDKLFEQLFGCCHARSCSRFI